MCVNVILCSRNGEKYLRAQIESILKQTEQSVRLLISDDVSSDRTQEIEREYAEQYPKHDGYTYRYFEVDGGDAEDRMMIGSTEDNIAIYYKDSAASYSKIADLLTHTVEDGSSIDTVLRFNNRYLFRAIYNNSVANKVKLQIGELIRQDDVVVFLFDSCVDDPERAAIRDLLLQKYNRTVVTNGWTPSDVLLCYKPDLDIMSDNDDLRTQILNQCKIAK